LLKGLEISIIRESDLEHTKKRLDSEYYKKEFLILDEKIKKIGKVNLKEINAVLDCSAFYPSIVESYSFNGEGIPFLRVNEIKNGLLNITDTTAFLPQKVLIDNPSTICIGYPNDLVIAKGGNSLAKVGLLNDTYSKYALSRDIILIRTKKLKNYDTFFLWIFFHSKFGQALLWRTASQTGQPHLTLPSINEIFLPNTNLSFVNKIKIIYEKSIIKKELSKQRYIKAENLLLEALGLQNFNPSSIPVNVKSLKESFLDSGRLDAEYYQLKYEDLFERIVSRKHKLLGSLVNIKKSIEPGSSAYKKEGIPFIRVANLSKFGISEPDIHLDAKEYGNIIQPKKDTILLTKDGSVGIAYKLNDDIKAITSGAILHLTLKDKDILPDYLTLVLNSLVVKLQAERDAGGSIIQHWKPSEVHKVIIPIISKTSQQQIAELIQESFALKAESEKLLDVAKHVVEISIEESEERALLFLDKNS
jgi:type I restriction enzyme S subunit